MNDDNTTLPCGETVILRDESGVHRLMDCTEPKGHGGSCSHYGAVEESQ